MKLEFDRMENIVEAKDIKICTLYLGRHIKTNKKGLILKVNEDTFVRLTDNFIEFRSFYEISKRYDLFELSSDAVTIKVNKSKIL